VEHNIPKAGSARRQHVLRHVLAIASNISIADRKIRYSYGFNATYNVYATANR